MKYLLAFIFIVCGCTSSFAQKFSASVDAQLALPQADYKDVNAGAGYGLRANILCRPNSTAPVKLGLEFGIMEKARASQYFSGNVSGYNDEFKVSATSNIVSLMFLSRFQSSQPHKLKPFLDVTAGWNVFFSTVSVEDVSYNNSGYDPSYSNSSKARWALSYGGAGGIDISLNRRDDIGLELKVAYIIGSYTNYLTNPYIDGNGNVSFQNNNSRTDMLIPQAGIRMSIH